MNSIIVSSEPNERVTIAPLHEMINSLTYNCHLQLSITLAMHQIYTYLKRGLVALPG